MGLHTFIAIFLLVLNFYIAYSNHIVFEKLCSEEQDPSVIPGSGSFSSGTLLMNSMKHNNSWYLPNLNCSITFSAQPGFQLFLTFSNISLRNSSLDNLTVFYNSEKTQVVLYGQQVCSNENCEGLKFDSGEFNNITLKFVSANVTVPYNLTGFRAHYTAYNTVNPKSGACQYKKQFLCENGHCIWEELVCDGHNNCGDRSDETKCIIPVKDTVWGIVVIVLAIISIIVFVPLFCCLAVYGTRSIVTSVMVTNQATPLLATADLGEGSGLLTSSEAAVNYWPGTSYERSNSFSYGTAQSAEPASSSNSRRQFRSMSGGSCEPSGSKLL